MRPSAAFLGKFLALAAVLFGLWSFAGCGDAYSRAVIAAASPFIRVLTGFGVSAVRPKPGGLDVFISRGAEELLIPLQPREMFSGLIPFLALVGATAGLSARRRLRAWATGVGVLFVFHLGLMLLGPYFTGVPQARLPIEWVRRVNTLIDIFYGFYGLVGYAALPFLLWFMLTERPPPERQRTRA